MKRLVCLCILCLSTTGCGVTKCELEPKIINSAQPHEINRLPSAFAPLTPDECKEEWSTELIIGDRFAKELDLYRAITAYKRALFLLPDNAYERRLQLQYNIILSYYLGNKYQDAINVFEQSDLVSISPSFPALDTLLTILYDCYFKLEQYDKADRVLEVIQHASPETASDLTLYTLTNDGELPCLTSWNEYDNVHPGLSVFLCDYKAEALSPRKAQILNAVLPGAGYLYVGQKKSALTSFIINTLFIAAAYQFFEHGYPAAGIITTSIEMGWYIGGINGAGLEAQEWNNRLYETHARKFIHDDRLIPFLMINTAF